MANFIAGMHLKKGALHRSLGVPIGKKIPVEAIRAAAKKKGKLGMRARTALKLESY